MFGFNGVLQLPPDPVLPPDPIPFVASAPYTNKVEVVLNWTGPGTTPIPFGTLLPAGALGIFMRYDKQSGPSQPPIQITLNVGQFELTPGGIYVLVNPTPQSGITSGNIQHSLPGTVRVWLLG